MQATFFFFALIAITILWFVSIYNSFKKLTNQLKEADSDIDVQLKRRHNLIPNLVETVKGYAKHEDQVFTKVTEARTRAMGAQTMKDKEESENALMGTLKSLFAVAENYPQLRASENFQHLQQELVDTEDKIQAARRFYNSVGRDLNIKVESVPSNIVANMFGFKTVDLFKAQDSEKEVVQVKF